jgi:hypothetical protein
MIKRRKMRDMKEEIAAPERIGAAKSPIILRTITEQEAGQRIDNFLMRHFKSVPRSRVYRLLRKGEVRVNKKRVDAEYRMAAGDEVRLPPVRIDSSEEPGRPSTSLQELIEKSVIFQDKHLLVINKPPGVAVHGGSGMSFGVIEALRASRPRETLELVHRLDRDTSGCLCIARVGQLAARHQANRRTARDRWPQPRRAARARRRRGQEFGERVQAGAILCECCDADGGGYSDRTHSPDTRARRFRGSSFTR